MKRFVSEPQGCVRQEEPRGVRWEKSRGWRRWEGQRVRGGVGARGGREAWGCVGRDKAGAGVVRCDVWLCVYGISGLRAG